MKKFVMTINKVNKIMMWVAGALMMVMAILVFYAVIMRYFLNKPPIWSFDLTSWFTGIVAFLSGGYALMLEEHVKVDLFYEKFSLRIKSWINVFATMFIALIVFVLIWKGFEQVLMNYKSGAIASTGFNIYIWIKWLMIPIGAALLGLQAIANLLKDFYVIFTNREMFEKAVD